MTAAPPTVSVALATYNGGAYLAEQLQSMAAQTVPIDELIVGDDGSTDATLEVLREFAATAPFPVRIEINAQNLGYGENFSRIIGRCSGKYIFLSDQDDRWHPDKVERCLGTFGETGALVLVHDAALVDAQLVPTGHTMMGQAKALNADALDGLFYGCCMAIDRFLVPFLTRERMDYHDIWLGVIARMLGGRTILAEPLIDYRRHGNNFTAFAMTQTRKATWVDGLRQKVAAIRNEPAAEALRKALAWQEDLAASFQANRAAVDDRFGDGTAERILSATHAEMRVLSARLAVQNGMAITRPLRVARLWRAGGYPANAARSAILRDILG